MAIGPGEMLSRYRLVEKVGEGGMGVVWKALDTELNRHVAIKILPPGLTSDPERRLRFKREAQAAAALSHPNIAVIHEIGEHEGSPFIAMEFLKGQSLRERLRGRPLPIEDCLRLALPIAEGLAHAHQNGIVHRDLKPDNVILTEDGQTKLLDFGLAKLLHPDQLEESAAQEVHSRLHTISKELTRAGKVFGTVAYMSPEQARGKPVDHRSDIFSFGVLLYEMTTGRLPFKGDSDVESLSATLSQEPPAPSEISGEVPPEVERVVRKSLEKEPRHRYQHADDLATDLRTLRRDLDSGRVSIPSRTPSRPVAHAGGGKGFRGKQASIMIGALVLVLVVAGIWITQRMIGDKDATPGSANETKPDASDAVLATKGPQRIVVLPFENLGPSEDEYFAAGVTEEIIGRLASVPGVAPISRTSAFQYDKSGKSLKQIGEDFGVDHVLDGTVRWARNSDGSSRVRISPQLVRVSDDTSVWAETYDRPMDDIFRVQSEIAGQVIEALGVVLPGGGDQGVAEVKLTDNQEAYQAYLRGQEYLANNPYSETGTHMFQRAVDLDPGFAEAWAGLSRSHSWRFHGGDRSSGHCEASKKAADEAIRIAPEAPGSHMAVGLYHYRCFRDYKSALNEIHIAGRNRPNDTDVLTWTATIHKRQGELEESVKTYQRVVKLDPMDLSAFTELSQLHRWLRNYPEAERYGDQAIAVAPDKSDGYMNKSAVHRVWTGSASRTRTILEAVPDDHGDSYLDREWLEVELLAGNYQEAMRRVEQLSEMAPFQDTLFVRASQSALLYELMEDSDLARKSWSEAMQILEREIGERPDDYRAYADLGLALSGLGRNEEALRAADRSTELMPLSKDFETAIAIHETAALTYARAGKYGEALDMLEVLLSQPSDVTIAKLRTDPRWRMLRNLPRFADLEKRFGN